VVIKKKFSRNSTIGDIMSDPNGAEIAKGLKKDIFGEEDNSGDGLGTDRSAMFNDFVLRSMVIFSGDKFTEEMMESLLEKLNSI
jgi:beta-glucosidase